MQRLSSRRIIQSNYRRVVISQRATRDRVAAWSAVADITIERVISSQPDQRVVRQIWIFIRSRPAIELFSLIAADEPVLSMPTDDAMNAVTNRIVLTGRAVVGFSVDAQRE